MYLLTSFSKHHTWPRLLIMILLISVFFRSSPFLKKGMGTLSPFLSPVSGHAIQLFGGEKGRNGDPNGTGLGKYCFDATSCVSSEESDTLYSL